MSGAWSLKPKAPPPEEDPPGDDPPEDDPPGDDSPEGPTDDDSAGDETPAASTPRQPRRVERGRSGPPFDPFGQLHDSPLRLPSNPWDPVFIAHRAPPRSAAFYETLWQESQARRDEIWTEARKIIFQSVKDGAAVNAPVDLHPYSYVLALRACESAAESAAVLAWLERIYVEQPGKFSSWVTHLIGVTRVQDDLTLEEVFQFGDEGLLYEVVLGELRSQDDKWKPSQPLPSVRFAAMLNSHLQEWPLLVFSPRGAKWGFRERYVARWRRYFEDWMLYQAPARPAWRLLLVPGKSRTNEAHIDDKSAEDSSVTRAVEAVDRISWHLEACPADKVLVVLVSGGQVRSETAEADYMGDILRDPKTWNGAVPSNLVIVEDALSRHTSNNLRAAAQLSLRLGLRGFWVKTGVGHATATLTGMLGRYRDETTWGLPASERRLLKLIAPMVRRACGPGTDSADGQLRYGELQAMVFVPAVGDALNP